MTRSRIASSALTLALAGFAGACGTTGGRPISLSLAVERSGPASFTTATGWDVVLDEAHLLVGAVYAYAPEGAVASIRRLERLLVPVARAHGGVDPYGGRVVRCEWLSQVAVDLLAPAPTSLGVGHGSFGAASDATVLLDAPAGALADPSGPLRGHHAWVAGTATSPSTGASIAFEGGLDISDEGTARLVEGIALAATLDDGGEVRMAVALSRWLDAVHFDRLLDAGAAPRALAEGTQGHVAWLLAVREPRTWSTTYAAAAVPGAGR